MRPTVCDLFTIHMYSLLSVCMHTWGSFAAAVSRMSLHVPEGFSLPSSAHSFSYLSHCHSSPEEEEGAEHGALAALWGQLSLSTFMVVLTLNSGHRAFAGFPEPSHWPPGYSWWKDVYLCVCKCLPAWKYVYHVSA